MTCLKSRVIIIFANGMTLEFEFFMTEDREAFIDKFLETYPKIRIEISKKEE
jgi:hypothetical protein